MDICARRETCRAFSFQGLPFTGRSFFIGPPMTIIAPIISAGFGAGGGTPLKIFHVQDQKASGTNGGTLTDGAWRTHDLNTVITNEIPGASLGSNKITFTEPGDYFGTGICPIFNSSVTQARMQDVANSVTLAQSVNQYNIGSTSTSNMVVHFEFSVVDDPVEIEFQVQSVATSASTGFGIPANIGTTEVFADVRTFKVS